MADGELILKLDPDTARRLQAAADAAHRPIADYAADLIVEGLGADWGEALQRLAEYDRTGEFMTLEEGEAFFRQAIDAAIPTGT